MPKIAALNKRTMRSPIKLFLNSNDEYQDKILYNIQQWWFSYLNRNLFQPFSLVLIEKLLTYWFFAVYIVD